MGTTVTKSGVSVQLCNSQGEIAGPPAFSTHVALLGLPRDEAIKRSGREATEEEKNFPGSDDWLTLIAIADSAERLAVLVNESGAPILDAQTSASSRRVQVQLHMGELRLTFDDRITIASGPIISLEPPKMNVVHIKVLGEGAAMNPNHPLFEEFKAQAPVKR